MKYFHTINIRAFTKKFPKTFKEELDNFIQTNTGLKDNFTEIQKLEEIEDFEHKLYLISGKIDKKTNIFMRNLLNKFNNEQIQDILDTLDTRIDEEGNFYIRLDKPKFLRDQLELTDSGDCVHFRIKIAAYPKNKDNAINTIRKFIENERS